MTSWSKLAKYLSGEASPREKKEVEQWISQNPNHRKSYEETKMYWKKIENSHDQPTVDVDQAWDNLKSRIMAEQQEEERDQSTTFRLMSRKVLRYAAMALLLIGLGAGGFYTYRHIQTAMHTVTVKSPDHKSPKQITLPDGSLAMLNQDSKINYPKAFRETTRSINIKGEVYFEVERNTEKPFVISARDARIEVLGTSFNVNTHFPESKVEVYVASGKVRMSRKNHPQQYLVIQPGYKGILTPKALKKVKNTDNNYISWATGRLRFKGQQLSAVTQTLMRTYNVNIEIADESVKQNRITTSFTNEPIDTVLTVIATTFNLEVEKSGKNDYVLKSGN